MTVTTVFFDVGGVLLSNAWDRVARARAVKRFDLDADEFQTRHAQIYGDFETGRVTLSTYLDRAVFYRPQPFSRDEFCGFMFEQSSAFEAHIEFVRQLAGRGSHRLAMLNNESRELNAHRLDSFGLRPLFSLFVSSCYVGCRKPDEAIFLLALDLTGQRPDDCVFIDDRAANVQAARAVGIRAIEFEDLARLRTDLNAVGVTP